jgi:glucose/arabinose dehydrogenase
MISPLKLLLGTSLLISCSNLSAPEKKGIQEAVVKNNLAGSEQIADKYNLGKITLPPGFHITVFAEVPNARSMCLSPNGTLYVGTKESSKVYAVRDENHDGKVDKVYTIASGLRSPNGVAFKDGSLYIATISTILRMDNIEQHLTDPPKPVTVFDKYPTEGMHGWKFIAFGPDGKLYVPVGAPCNICESANPVFASITRMNANGTGMEIYARGIRNTVGFAWHPSSKELWFTDNGGDGLGDNMPNDELNKAPYPGMNFGYPYCHQGNYLDPNLGKGKRCGDYVPPVKLLGPHVAALGMRFYTGSMFPPEYRSAIFIAEHGSWNRSEPIGYRVAVIKQQSNGSYGNPQIFAQGWLDTGGEVTGRPVDVQQMSDGSLLVSDDYSGVIYRISYKER